MAALGNDTIPFEKMADTFEVHLAQSSVRTPARSYPITLIALSKAQHHCEMSVTLTPGPNGMGDLR